MKPLSKIPSKTSVFILELPNEEAVTNRLKELGLAPRSIITVVSNKDDELVIECEQRQMLLSKDDANTILVSNILDSQERIFEGNQTKQRSVILSVLKRQKGHFTLEELTQKVQKKDPRIGQITVYRALKTLIEKNIVETITKRDGTREFEIHKGHHDHIICQNCGNVYEFHDVELEKAKHQIAARHGMVLSDHKLQLFGMQCPRCDD